MSEHTETLPGAGPTWASGAARAHLTLVRRAASTGCVDRRSAPSGIEVLVANNAHRRRVGWSHAAPPDPGSSRLTAVFFSFDVVAYHGFWMRDVALDLDLLHLDRDGVVLALQRLEARSEAFVFPPEPVCYALQLPAGEAEALGVEVGDRWLFDPAAVAPIGPEHAPEPALTPAPEDDPALIERWSQREHMYSTRPFAAAAGLMGWQLRVGPEQVAIWLHAGGGFVLHPPLCPLGPLEALGRSLGLAWLRVELAPCSRLLLPDGRVVVETFDPRTPDDWLARMRAHGLHPTTGRWQFTRTLLVDLTGDAELERLPPRIRYEARAFQRLLDAGRYRVEVVPGAAFDQRQERALAALHGAWLAAHPDAEDNLAFCRPMAHGYGAALTAYLCWDGNTLLAVQLHVLWNETLYFLFAESVASAPQGLTPGLLWHGVRRAKAAPFGPSGPPDLLDLVGAVDPRYPEFRAFGGGFTRSKLRWHPSSVWLPPSVAFAGMELPP